ncbi:MAG: TRAP transporter substrate-binding protein DctP [Gammaproteobacteria bacterium]|nr:TRAP transporter substrate-binding protein DctP [Gammaproteobacteria bacterium]
MFRLCSLRATRVASKAGGMLVAGALVAASLPASAELQPLNIRIAADLTGPPHPVGITLEYMAERLPEVIPGSKMRIYYAGALYRIPEAVEAMTDGNLEMTWGQYGKTSQIEPYMSVVNGPMLLTTPGALNAFEDFETVKMLNERMDKIHGVKIFGTGHLSMYMGVGAGSRIIGPDDFAGKKIRSMGPAENAALSQWGANPVTMAFGDVPPALETKVIDGLLTSLGGFNSTKDQAPFFTVAGINGVVGDYYWIGASNIWWNRLNKDTQAAFQKFLVDEIIPFQKRANWCNDKRVLDKFGTDDPSKPGIFILKEAQAELLADKLGTATQDWIKSKTPKDAHQWVDKFVQEARAASKSHPLGSDPLEKTDCTEMMTYFDKYAKKK